jgi:hypothetical protein
MSKRVNIMLPDTTVKVLDRVAPKGDRSRFISQAVLHYVQTQSRAKMARALAANVGWTPRIQLTHLDTDSKVKNAGSGAKAGALDGAVLDTDFSGLPALTSIYFFAARHLLLQPPVLRFQFPNQPDERPVLVSEVRQLFDLWSTSEGLNVEDIVARPLRQLIDSG